MTERSRIETTYADLRPTDLVIDKTGRAWPIADLEVTGDRTVDFWLCDPVTKIRMHSISRDGSVDVTVSRAATHADEAEGLEADFPRSTAPSGADGTTAPMSSQTIPDGIGGDGATESEAIAAVEAIGGEVEAVVTAEEVDTAAAATEDKPVRLPSFDVMDILEMRSHLYLLHGVYAHDMRSRLDTIAMHEQAHVDHDAGRLKSRYVPHVHTGEA